MTETLDILTHAAEADRDFLEPRIQRMSEAEHVAHLQAIRSRKSEWLRAGGKAPDYPLRELEERLSGGPVAPSQEGTPGQDAAAPAEPPAPPKRKRGD